MSPNPLRGRPLAAVLVTFCCLGSPLSHLAAQVRINELVARTSEWRLKWDADGQPSVGAGSAWWSPSFTRATTWATGAAPLGWGSGIATDVSGLMEGLTPNLYLRKEFAVSAGNAASGANLLLDVEYDDGIIVWINGKEVARCNLGPPGLQIFHEQVAFRGSATTDSFNLGAANNHLVQGTNVIAVQVANRALTGALKAEASLEINGGTNLVPSGSTWSYFPGHVEPSGGLFEPSFLPTDALTADWGALGYDLSSWETGLGPIGYDANADYALGTNLVAEMRNKATSVYMRQSFAMTAGEIAAAGGLRLTADYDDGFIAYLNGVEIARGTMGSTGQFYAFNAKADSGHNASTDSGSPNPPVVFNFDKSLLRAGENVLSAQSHNSGINSSDLMLDMTLETTGGGPGVVAPNNGTFDYLVGAAEPPPGASNADSPESEFVDWLELHNEGTEAVDLSGWSITDDSAEPAKFVLPDGTSIPAGGYLVILADDKEEFNGTTTYLHASFSLSGDGEFLGLYDDNGAQVSALDPEYPSQRVFHSYGVQPGGTSLGYLDEPTPGEANSGPFFSGRVDAPDFSVSGGFHTGTVNITLTSQTSGATIRYTTDGTDPTPTNGLPYSAPLSLTQLTDTTGHCIRARGFKAGHVDSKVKTQTYLIDQKALLTGAPALLMSGDAAEVFYKPNGVLAIDGGSYFGGQWQAGDKDDYNIPINRGRSYERAGFIEYYEPGPTGGKFREEMGVRIAASNWSRPRMRLTQTGSSPFPSSSTQKPSFNIWFRGDYDEPEIDFPWLGEDYHVRRFSQLRPRAGKNDIRNPFIRDELARRLYHDMGQHSALGVINTLYINGIFKGYYNLCERLREPFMQSHHDSDRQWDIRQVDEFAEGDDLAWNEMMVRLQADLSVEANWLAALDYIDPIATADYFLVNIYGATWDWPQNNWVGARERSVDGRFRFYVWDAEGAFTRNPNYNSFTQDLLTQGDTLSTVFQALYASEEWRMIFADRVHRHLFHEGALDDRDQANSNIRQRKDALVTALQPLLTCVHGDTLNEGFYNTWTHPTTGRRNYLIGPQDDLLRDNDLWPATEPPTFSQHGGTVPAGFQLGMTKADPGQIYYTLDGTDPRGFGDTISPTAVAFSGPATLTNLYVTARARVLDSNGEWSPLTEADFGVGTVPATSANLAVAEIMYHPADPTAGELAAGFDEDTDFEFLKLLNFGSLPIDITEVRLSSGITFDFSTGTVPALSPGDHVLVAENLDAFRARYGLGHDERLAGEWAGKLSNSGEALLVDDSGGTPIQSFSYLDVAPWPELPDGAGLALQIIDPAGAHSDPTNWQPSPQFGGTPGPDIEPLSFSEWQEMHFSHNPAHGDPFADPDLDGLNNFMEFAVGTLPNDIRHHLPTPEAGQGDFSGAEHLTITFSTWDGAEGVSYEVRVSPDLETWLPNETVEVSSVNNGDGTTTYLYRDSAPIGGHARRFLRLQIGQE